MFIFYFNSNGSYSISNTSIYDNLYASLLRRREQGFDCSSFSRTVRIVRESSLKNSVKLSTGRRVREKENWEEIHGKVDVQSFIH